MHGRTVLPLRGVLALIFLTEESEYEFDEHMEITNSFRLLSPLPEVVKKLHIKWECNCYNFRSVGNRTQSDLHSHAHSRLLASISRLGLILRAGMPSCSASSGARSPSPSRSLQLRLASCHPSTGARKCQRRCPESELLVLCLLVACVRAERKKRCAYKKTSLGAYIQKNAPLCVYTKKVNIHCVYKKC